jgi:hypothetical protein
LRTKNEVPNSLMNYDRHGMENLKHDHVKPLDRIKLPPYVIYAFIFLFSATIAIKVVNDDDENIEAVSRKALLIAMKKSKE